MKKIVLLFSVIVTAAAYVIAAEEKKIGEQSTPAAATEHKLVTPTEMQWGDGPAGLPRGAKMVALAGSPKEPGPFTVRFQFPANYKVPPHTHPTAEHVTVISGKLNLGVGEKLDQSASRELAPGSFGVMPAGMTHFAWTSEPTVVQIHGSGPFEIKYVNPADDPRNKGK
jgi:quercetin dioxygenase-like cupin family protein